MRSPNAPILLACGAAPMITHGATRAEGGAVPEGAAGGSQLGKRYVDAASGIELLCSKSGAGSLSVDGRATTLKEAKKLPSSD